MTIHGRHGRTNGLGTPINRLNEPKSNPVKPVQYIWTPEEIAQHLAKYPPAKLRLPVRETLYERMIRPREGERA